MERYRARVSGPLLDRIDLHVEVPAVTLKELRQQPAEGTLAVAERVAAARQRQRRRFGSKLDTSTNATLEGDDLRRLCHLEPDARKLLEQVQSGSTLNVEIAPYSEPSVFVSYDVSTLSDGLAKLRAACQ